MATILESILYEVNNFQGRLHQRRGCDTPNGSGANESLPPVPPNTAISIRNLRRTFRLSWWNRNAVVEAIADLSLDIPQNGIFVLLGSNG